MRTITEWSIFSLFTLTKPVTFRFCAIKSDRSVCNSHFLIMMSTITEWLRSAPPTRAPHVGPALFTIVLERSLCEYISRFWGIQGVNSFQEV